MFLCILSTTVRCLLLIKIIDWIFFHLPKKIRYRSRILCKVEMYRNSVPAGIYKLILVPAETDKIPAKLSVINELVCSTTFF